MKRLLIFLIVLGTSLPVWGQEKLRVAATPNPNIFPLLVAMKDDPSLPVEIVPIADGSAINAVFASGKADALLAMTYTAAKKVVSGKVPDLRLVYVGLWKGFSEVTFRKDHVKNFADLRGKGLIVAGPTGGGKNGGPDLIFQAALKHSGMSLADVKVCYLPVMSAVKLLKTRAPLNSNSKCNPGFNLPASGISLVEPAATGMIIEGLMPFSAAHNMERSIEFQPLFTGFSAWPRDELPHGGLAVLGTVLNDPVKAKLVAQVLSAYKKAIIKIDHAHAFRALAVSRTISKGITRYFGQYKLKLPAAVIMTSLVRKKLLFRADATPGIQGDLNRFLTDVIGASPPADFYALQ